MNNSPENNSPENTSPDVAILLVEARSERVWAGLSLAAAQAALGARVSLFLSGDAAALADPEYQAPCDARRQALGIATLGALLATCQALGVTFEVCQTGLHQTGLPAHALPDFITPSGLMSWLAQTKHARHWVF
jgi:predicted peroxiredoxin